MTHVQQAADIVQAFAAAYSAGRVEGLLALHEPNALAVDQEGGEHRGHEALGRNLTKLLALGGTMTSTNRYTFVEGDIALLSAEWRINTQDASGAPMVVSGRSAEVARRQADGRWLYVVDHPFGAQ